MFKIIGADGKEYGPVAAEQLRQWIAEGRANTQTLAQAESSVEWKPLGQIPEFASSATTPAPSTRLVPPSAQAAHPERNAMAITGLVMGIISVTIGLLCCGSLFGILGIIFSCIGLSQIKRDPAGQTGKSVASWGVALSVLGLMIGIGLAVLFGIGRGLGHHPLYWHYRYHW